MRSDIKIIKQAAYFISVYLLIISSISNAAEVADPVAAIPLKITNLEYQNVVVANGKREDIKIYWQGDPKLPVTAEYYPSTCKDSIDCRIVKQVFTALDNPFIFEKAVFCGGPFGQKTKFIYNIRLRDAEGRATLAWDANFYCQPEN